MEMKDPRNKIEVEFLRFWTPLLEFKQEMGDEWFRFGIPLISNCFSRENRRGQGEKELDSFSSSVNSSNQTRYSGYRFAKVIDLGV